jgi:molybdopterin/thiamine biosynthesis adenylyltransferase
MTPDDLAYSRPVATAARLADAATDYHRFVDKRVLLTGESVVLRTANGRACLLASLRLLIRICRRVTVALPVSFGALSQECRDLAERIAFGAPIPVVTGEMDPTAFDAVLNIGSNARPDLPWTVINAQGWLARVSSTGTPLPAACERENPISALAAACLGVGEVFKRLLVVRPDRGPLLDGVSFSLDSYRCDDADPGPPLPSHLPLDVLFVGVGAIGNGVVYLLSQLPIGGRMAIVDTQIFGEENLGTCILIGPADLGRPKVDVATELLRERLDVRPFHEDISRFAARLGTEVPYPSIVVNGLDNIDARHAVQGMWPDLIIDGAIGDLSCQVSRHPWGEETACLRCLFPKLPGESAERRAARATGLSLARAARTLEIVTQEDVGAAPEAKQAFLRSQIGKPICSVIVDAMAQELSEEQQRADFAPSVPFVACLSASMVAAELAKAVSGRTTPLECRFQISMLTGPTHGLELPQARRGDCQCVTRRRNIERVRLTRSTTA